VSFYQISVFAIYCSSVKTKESKKFSVIIAVVFGRKDFFPGLTKQLGSEMETDSTESSQQEALEEKSSQETIEDDNQGDKPEETDGKLPSNCDKDNKKGPRILFLDGNYSRFLINCIMFFL
jgi:hypothetical protein